MSGAHTSRGIRNNNPGNIRRSNTVWDGMAEQQPDPAFVTFTSAIYGLRAILHCEVILRAGSHANPF